MLTTVSEQKIFGGTQGVYRHQAKATQCSMEFSLFTPPQAKDGPVPTIWYLSGLTCTQDNATTKAGFQRMAAELGLMIICPDTSPRGEGVPDDPEGVYDFGLGAGFYLNATVAPYSTHYQMESYITTELPALIADHFPADVTKQGIMGHSMGGHGALTLWRKNPDTYQSISAFAPIMHPSQCPWGQKALMGYLGPDQGQWANYDICRLLEERGPIAHCTPLIDQGTADNFLDDQLMPDHFETVCKKIGQPYILRRQIGYDHSYYFMATFIEDHLKHHNNILNNG